jgi:hypothetical protein
MISPEKPGKTDAADAGILLFDPPDFVSDE